MRLGAGSALSCCGDSGSTRCTLISTNCSNVVNLSLIWAYPNEHSGKYPQKIPSPKQLELMISPDHSISSEHFNQN